MMVFISYKRQDKQFALEVRRRIDLAGFPTAMDVDIQGGEKWKLVIDDAIRRSDIVVVIVTPESSLSQYVTYEWSFALGLNKAVIPILYKAPDFKDVHPQLGDIHQLDFTNPRKRPWDQFIERLKSFDVTENMPEPVKRAEYNLYDDNTLDSAIKTLLRHPHPSAAKILEEACKNEYDEISGRAGIALAKKSDFQNRGALSGLSNALRVHNLWQEALNLLRQMNNSDAVKTLEAEFDRTVASNEKLKLRETQIAISEIKDPSVYPLLCKILQSEIPFQSIVLDAAANFRDPSLLPILDALFVSNRFAGEGLARIAKAVGTIGHRDGFNLLDKILKTLPYIRYQHDSTVFQALVAAWSSIGGQEALNILHNVYRDSRFIDYRQFIQKAVFEVDNRLKS